ncbi:hypothetical protein [Streptomyces yunnanensis]|uniref:Uncharacterized protein n=1 Tax=Streptomyces yunnanensis TaxID=156453 RepID=A0A9X8N9X2_9ACTN|nr:hypothetical protein SAMN05216268_1773 [Streptomyces yunnanensis]
MTLSDAPVVTPDAVGMPQTEFDFELPFGYVDPAGTVHRTGTMRVATARDELGALGDLRVKENPAYLTVVLLAAVISRLGTLRQAHADIVAGMRVADVAYLQEMYERINGVPGVEGRSAGGRLGES